jgi:hypothetical protein
MYRKIFGILMICLCFSVSCTRKDHYSFEIRDGLYTGEYIYQNERYYSGIEIDSNRYEEFPSGGYVIEKPGEALRIGRFSVSGNVIFFTADSSRTESVQGVYSQDLLLDGNFTINVFPGNDSIVFYRGSGVHSIYYHLKKYSR